MPTLNWWRTGGSKASGKMWASYASSLFFTSRCSSSQIESAASQDVRASGSSIYYTYSRIKGVY